MKDRPDVRSAAIGVLRNMGEMTEAQATQLIADPAADFDLVHLSFDSLVVLDFCLQIEIATGVVIDPADVAVISHLHQLERFLLDRQAN